MALGDPYARYLGDQQRAYAAQQQGLLGGLGQAAGMAGLAGTTVGASTYTTVSTDCSGSILPTTEAAISDYAASKIPKTFREKLQSETDEWLKGAL